MPGNPKPKATIVRIDGTQEDLYHKPSLRDLQEAVGGLIEYVEATDIYGNSVKLAVDENGRPKRKPINNLITERYGQSIPGRYIVGNAVILY